MDKHPTCDRQYLDEASSFSVSGLSPDEQKSILEGLKSRILSGDQVALTMLKSNIPASEYIMMISTLSANRIGNNSFQLAVSLEQFLLSPTTEHLSEIQRLFAMSPNSAKSTVLHSIKPENLSLPHLHQFVQFVSESLIGERDKSIILSEASWLTAAAGIFPPCENYKETVNKLMNPDIRARKIAVMELSKVFSRPASEE